MFKVVYTADGTPTVIDNRHQSSYHSMHGSVQESRHVFIEHGLNTFLTQSILDILEVGFGTGLNALLTYAQATSFRTQVRYTGYELYPLDRVTLSQIDYSKHVPDIDYPAVFKALHQQPDGTTTINDHFQLSRHQADFDEISDREAYDLIYMDAFGPGTQQAFWKRPFLDRLERALRPGGVLITYCAQGQFKRELRSLGFTVERLPGPPGKREITRAIKPTLT